MRPRLETGHRCWAEIATVASLLLVTLSGCSQASPEPQERVTAARQHATRSAPELRVGPRLGAGVYSLGDLRQRSPEIAHGADGSLIAWRDGSGDVYSARLDSVGAVLEHSEQLLGRSGPVGSGPAIAWSGSTYFVVWTATHGDGGDAAIEGVCVQPDGEVLDQAAVMPEATPDLDSRLAVAWNGSVFVTVWSERTLHAAVFDPRTETWSADFAVHGGQVSLGAQVEPALASDTTRTLLVWVDTLEGVRGCLLNSSGLSVAGSELTISSWGSSPVVAMGPSDALVAFGGEYAMRLGYDGAGMPVVGGALIELRDGLLDAEEDADTRSVVWTGSNYLTAWQTMWLDHEEAETHVTAVGADDVPEQLGSFLGLDASLGYSGSDAVLVLQRVSRDDFELEVLNVGLESTTSPRAGMSRTGPAIARAADAFFAVWRGPDGIQSARIGLDGEVLDATPLTLSSDAEAVDPVVASNGDVQLVIWREGGYSSIDDEDYTWMYAVRVTLEGEVIDAPPLGFSPGYESGFYRNTLAAASDGDGFLAVWSDEALDELRIVQIGASGPIESNEVLTQGYDPSVIWTGDHYFVTWATHDGVRSARISADGENLDQDEPLRVSETGGEHRDPAVAWDGESYLVVYVDAREGDADVRGLRLDESGAPMGLSDFLIAGGPGMQSDPTVAWDGTRFIIGWTDETSVDGSGVGVRRFDPASGQLEQPLAELTETDERAALPVLVSDGSGRTLFAHAHTSGAQPTYSWRVLEADVERCDAGDCAARDAGSGPADDDASTPGEGDASDGDSTLDEDDGACLCSAPGGSGTSSMPWLAPLGLLFALAWRGRHR